MTATRPTQVAVQVNGDQSLTAQARTFSTGVRGVLRIGQGDHWRGAVSGQHERGADWLQAQLTRIGMGRAGDRCRPAPPGPMGPRKREYHLGRIGPCYGTSGG